MRPTPICLALTLLACQAAVEPDPGEGFALRVGETATIPAAGLELTFLAVTGDSRCPVDVVCVWAGAAPVRLRVRLAARDTTLQLDPVQGPRAASVAGWRVELRDLTPAPHAGQPIPTSAYQAVLRVIRDGPAP